MTKIQELWAVSPAVHNPLTPQTPLTLENQPLFWHTHRC
jgi:hypothetical protein